MENTIEGRDGKVFGGKASIHTPEGSIMHGVISTEAREISVPARLTSRKNPKITFEGNIKIYPTVNYGGSTGNSTLFEYVDENGKKHRTVLDHYNFKKV